VPGFRPVMGFDVVLAAAGIVLGPVKLLLVAYSIV
jgi:hypothetical protein